MFNKFVCYIFMFVLGLFGPFSVTVYYSYWGIKWGMMESLCMYDIITFLLMINIYCNIYLFVMYLEEESFSNVVYKGIFLILISFVSGLLLFILASIFFPGFVPFIYSFFCLGPFYLLGYILGKSITLITWIYNGGLVDLFNWMMNDGINLIFFLLMDILVNLIVLFLWLLEENDVFRLIYYDLMKLLDFYIWFLDMFISFVIWIVEKFFGM